MAKAKAKAKTSTTEGKKLSKAEAGKAAMRTLLDRVTFRDEAERDSVAVGLGLQEAPEDEDDGDEGDGNE